MHTARSNLLTAMTTPSKRFIAYGILTPCTPGTDLVSGLWDQPVGRSTSSRCAPSQSSLRRLWQIVLHFSEWTLDRFTPSFAWIWLVGQMDGRCHRAFGQSLSSVFCFVPNYCGYPWGCGVLGCCSAFVISAASAKVSTYCSEWTLGRSFRAIYQ